MVCGYHPYGVLCTDDGSVLQSRWVQLHISEINGDATQDECTQCKYECTQYQREMNSVRTTLPIVQNRIPDCEARLTQSGMIQSTVCGSSAYH
jgi:hypothetical protein